ncbi:MAG: nucleoside monophosphate kinase [archaeon]|jgi:adenylate kinase
MSLNLIFLGPPGAGKGSVAQAVGKKYNLMQVSTGDLIRAEVASGSALGKKLAEIINGGELVSDSITKKLLVNKLDALVKAENFKGFILDGFPRNVAQAESLEKILSDFGQELSAVIYIESSEESIVARLSGRWQCPTCKKVYNASSNPPKNAMKCDIEGSELFQRDDDKPETIRKRYQIFLEQTLPLVDFYDKKNLLQKYDGNVPLGESVLLAEAIVSKL